MPDQDERSGQFALDTFYVDYPRVEEQFQSELGNSLHPRSWDYLYEIVRGLELPVGAVAVDLGCGEGEHSLELARRFPLSVIGVDPVDRHIELAGLALDRENEEVRSRVQFLGGSAGAIPVADDSVSFIWCREVLYHVPALDEAFEECRRVLGPAGRMVVAQLFGTERLEPNEGEWLWRTLGVIPDNADHRCLEDTITGGGLCIVENIELGSEFGEWAEEHKRKPSRELLSAARLLRDPQRYIDQFGPAAYDIKLADSLWHVYRMIGKLSNRIYVIGLDE